MTSSTMFKRWVKQWIKYYVSESEYFIQDAPIYWADPKEPPKPKIPDCLLEAAVETSESDHFAQLCFESDFECNKVINSGSRPVAKEPDECELPF